MGRPFWADEEMLALNVRGRSLGQLAGALWLDQSAPLGWLVVERLVLVAFGTGERALRLMPLLFGFGTLACALWVGRRLTATGAALLALLCASGSSLAYHALELKPYSSDAFWALLLAGVAAWVLDAATIPTDDGRRATRRLLAWWAVAAIGQWFGNGATLVTPACAAVLHVALWRRHGWRASAVPLLGALGWLASFAIHYELALRHAFASSSLKGYWSFAMGPAPASLGGSFEWALSRLRPLADKPAGTSYPVTFWLLVAAGMSLAIGARPAHGMLLALVPLSALILGGLRIVPVYERLSLWIVPALYIAVAVAADGVARLARGAAGRRRVVALLAAGVAALPVCLVTFDVARNGSGFLLRRPTDDYHMLDDRSGVRWLMRQAVAGDAVMTTRLALPAVWWYGSESWVPGEPLRSRGRILPAFEAVWVSSQAQCAAVLPSQLGHPSHVLLYLGFRLDDWPEARENRLLASLAEIGAITGFRHFARYSGAIVVDPSQPPSPGPQLPPRPWAPASAAPAVAGGCIAARPAVSW